MYWFRVNFGWFNFWSLGFFEFVDRFSLPFFVFTTWVWYWLIQFFIRLQFFNWGISASPTTFLDSRTWDGLFPLLSFWGAFQSFQPVQPFFTPWVCHIFPWDFFCFIQTATSWCLFLLSFCPLTFRSLYIGCAPIVWKFRIKSTAYSPFILWVCRTHWCQIFTFCT